MKTLWYTGYAVMSFTFLALAYVEWQVPGFVSAVFPMYVVLGLAFVCGLGALANETRVRQPQRGYEVVALGLGIVLALVVFKAGDVFGAFRLVLAIAVLFLPLLLLKGVADDKK